MLMFDWETRCAFDKVNAMYKKGREGRKKRRQILKRNNETRVNLSYKRRLQWQQSIKNAQNNSNLDYHVDITYQFTSRNNSECMSARMVKEQINDDLKALFWFSKDTLRLACKFITK